MPQNKKQSFHKNTLKRSKNHTSRVKLLRRFLPTIGAISILSVLLWSSFETFFEKKIEGIPRIARNLVKHNKVINPHLKSTNSKGDPYHIQAESATQNTDAQVSFEKPCCDTLGKKGRKINLKSDKGSMNQKEQKFIYNDNVHLETSDGYSFKTKKAIVDLKSQNVTGEDPVVGHGPAGQITSKEGFFLDKSTQELHFKGPTQLTIHPNSLPKKEVKK